MKCEVENLDGHRKKVSIEVPPEIVTGVFNRVLRGMQENVELKGFRKGKVPLEILRTQYQQDTSKHVIREIIEESLPQALKSNSLKPAENPKIESGTLLDGFPFKYSVTFENTPPVNLKNYMGFKTKIDRIEVKTEEVNDSLHRLHESLARFDDAEADALDGNICGDLELWSAESSEKIPETKSTRLTHELGHGPLVPEMEEKVRGMKKGEDREFTLEVPTNPEADEKKTFFYKAHLHGLKTKNLPPLDDETAKRFGNFNSVTNLREKIENEIKKQKETVQRETMRQKLVEYLVSEHDIEVPEALRSRWMQTLVLNYAAELGRLGLPQDQIEERLKEQGDNFLSAATHQAKASLILEAIAEKEKIQASEEDFRKEILRMAIEQGRNPKEVFEEIEKRSLIGAVVEKIEEVKTLDWLLGKALEA